MHDMPYLQAPEGSKFLFSPFYVEGYYGEIGMIENGFLEGWGMRWDRRHDTNNSQFGSYHLGRLHGIGLSYDFIAEQYEVGVFLNGEYVTDEEAFGKPIFQDEDSVSYLREPDGQLPFPVYLTVYPKEKKKAYAFDKKRGFLLLDSEERTDVSFLSLEGLEASEEQIAFMCLKPGTASFGWFEFEDIPEKPNGFGLCLQPKFNAQMGGYVPAEGTIPYLHGYYKGEVDEEGKPHGHGRFEWGYDIENYHHDQYEYYEGQWEHGLRQGLGIYAFLDTRTNSKSRSRYIGEWKNDQKEGLGVEFCQCYQRVSYNFYPASEAYRGTFIGGKRDGTGILQIFSPTESGMLLSSHDFKSGIPEGTVEIRYYDTGDIYYGGYNGYHREGEGTYYIADSDATFSATWTSDGPKPESIRFESKKEDMPFLLVSHHDFGFDNDNTFLALFPAKVGVTGMDGMSVLYNSAGREAYFFKVLSIDGNEIKYAVAQDYSAEKIEEEATIKPGEKKHHGFKESKTAIIEGDPVDCQTGTELDVICL